MDRVMVSRRHKPSFFKVMVGDFQNKMRIPRGFIKNFNDVAPKKIYLRNSTGRSWTVPVRQIGEDLFLCNEWWNFAEDHALEDGDFLVFEYNGHANFTVKIFTKTACEKETTSVQNSTETANCHHREQSNSRKKARNFSYTSRVAYDEIDSALPGGKPNFTIVMRHTYVCAYWPFLSVPHIFARRYLGESSLEVALHNSDDDVWPVLYTTGPQYRLSKGWKTFVSDNHLKLHDVCRFELLAKSSSHADLKFSVIN